MLSMWMMILPKFLLGCEDGNNDGAVAGEVVPLCYSLKKIIKAPELAERELSKGMLKAGKSDHIYHRPDEGRKGQSMGNTLLTFFSQ